MSAIVGTGMILRVIPRTTFSATLTGTSSQTITFPIAQHIDVGPFQEVDLQVRVHAITLASSTITLLYGVDGFTEEDPANATTNFQTNLGSGTALSGAGYQVVNLTSSVFGRLMFLNLQLTSSTLGSPSITLSIDLVCKSGDPSGIQPRYNTYRGYR